MRFATEQEAIEFSSDVHRGMKIYQAARAALAAFRKDRDRLTYDQWQALEALEEALYGGEE